MKIVAQPHPDDPRITLLTLAGRLDTLTEPAAYKIFKLASFDEAFNVRQDEVSAMETIRNQNA